MREIQSFEIFALDLPFKKPFKHAAASRTTSSSIFVKCTTDNGISGYGECLPRSYVTGENRDDTFLLLKENILPQLIGKKYNSLNEIKDFLLQCDGKAPEEWLDPSVPQTAAWCAVDLALLDTFGRVFSEPIYLNSNSAFPPSLRYSVVISSDARLKTLLLIRLMAIPQVKIKVEKDGSAEFVQRARRIMGSRCDIRADANMAWNVEEALRNMKKLAEHGIQSFEQPIKADDIDGLATLVKESRLGVMVDESLHDRESLERLLAKQACTAVNIRISKCGGLMAAFNRCIQALEAGMILQVGCQVGESSLLSAAQLKLLTAVPQINYAEGCFGRLLLKEDPVTPLLQFGYAGRPPQVPAGSGLGINVNDDMLSKWCSKKEIVN